MNDEQIMKAVTESEEYKELDDSTRKSINGLLALITTGTIPGELMAQMVLTTAVGVALRDNEKLMTLIDGGVWHRKGTSDLVVVAGGWAWEIQLTPLATGEDIDYSDLERM